MTVDLTKPVDKMTTAELVEASWHMTHLKNRLVERRKHPEVVARFKKLKTAVPDTVNPAFTNLQTSIQNEIKKRKGN